MPLEDDQNNSYEAEALMPTSRLPSRLFSLIIDWLLIVLVVQILTWPLTGGDLSPFRLSQGLLNTGQCFNAIPKGPNGEQLDLSNWTAVGICDVTHLPFAKNRIATFRKDTQYGNNGSQRYGTYKKISLPVDSTGRLTQVIYLDFLIPLLLLVLTAVLEASPWQRTPGKWVFGLKVIGKSGFRLSFSAAIQRNLVRLSPFIGLTLANAFLSGTSYKQVLVGNQVVFSTMSWANIGVFVTLSIVLIIWAWGNLFIPWSKRGVGRHNKMTNSQVINSVRFSQSS